MLCIEDYPVFLKFQSTVGGLLSYNVIRFLISDTDQIHKIT